MVNQPLKNNFLKSRNKGTKVIWKKIDRADLTIDTPSTNATIRNIRDHLGLVFHRFIDSKNEEQKNLKIKFNGITIESLYFAP